MTDRKTYGQKSHANAAFRKLFDTVIDRFPNAYPNGDQNTDVKVIPGIGAATDRYMITVSLDCMEKDVPQALKDLLIGHSYECLRERPQPEKYDAPEYDASNPLLGIRKPIKPYPQWERSAVDTPVAICFEVYNWFLAEGRIDERKDAIAQAMSLGVARNTAHTQYRRFRLKVGLSPRSRDSKI